VKVGVLQFPGSNCDQDAFYAVKDMLNTQVEYLWHQDSSLKGCELIIVPGGFSFGDYLRCGAIARFSPVMTSVIEHANSGGLVIGICNGFQILCESGLLPGALVRNNSTRFVCKHVSLKVENADTLLTKGLSEGQILSIPVAHGEGCYVSDKETLARLNSNNQVIFRYASDSENVNGSIDNIAGIANDKFNVFGMMPHPERACDIALGSSDGLSLLKSLIMSKN
jgi:phosphoribosylformylglycinamidine synthase